MGSDWEPEFRLDCISNKSGLAVALSGHLGQLVCLSRAGGPEITEVLVTVVARGVAALLGGVSMGLTVTGYYLAQNLVLKLAWV